MAHFDPRCLVIYFLGGPLSYGSPAVVFLDHGHPCFWNFYSSVPVDIVRVNSYVNHLCVCNNEDHDTSVQSGWCPVSWACSETAEVWVRGEFYFSVILLHSVLHWSSSLADVNFTVFTWNSVNHSILFSRVNSVFRPY